MRYATPVAVLVLAAAVVLVNRPSAEAQPQRGVEYGDLSITIRDSNAKPQQFVYSKGTVTADELSGGSGDSSKYLAAAMNVLRSRGWEETDHVALRE